MIYITGDIHANIDIGKLSSSNFPEGKHLTKKDYVIICGDFGLVWDESPREMYWRQWLNDKPWTTLWVDGNHERYDFLNDCHKFPVCRWHGGKVQFVTPDIIHLMRGQVYDLDGLKLFSMGGASSHDKEDRIEGFSWWKEELPSNEEYDEAIDNLIRVDNSVDVIISHCASDSIMKKINSWYVHDKLTNFFEHIVERGVIYKHWFFGHYHIDREIDDKHTVLYNTIVRLDNYL